MKKVIPFIGFFIFFFVLSCIITFPLLFHLSSLTTGRGDELLIAWIHTWGFHALITNPLHVFSANIFYPFLYSFAYSDMHLTSMLFGSIPYLLLGEPIVFNNVSLLLSLTLLGWSIALVIYVITKDYLPAFFAGVLISLSPAVLDKAIHLQVLFIFFLPLGILSLYLFLTKRKQVFLFLALVCFVLQSLNSFMAGYFIVLSYACMTGVALFTKQVSVRFLFNKKHVLFFCISLLFLAPIIYPYIMVSKEYQYKRDIRDSIHFSLSPEDYFYPNSATRLEPFLHSLQKVDKTKTNGEYKVGYLGGVFTLLVIMCVIYLLREKHRSFLFVSLFLTGLSGFLLSLGPFLHLGRATIHYPFPIPLPYLLFYYLAPGFNGFRSSARFEMLFIVASALCIGLLLHKLLTHVSFKGRVGTYGVLLGLVIWEFTSPFTFIQAPQVTSPPVEYQWLKKLPQEKVLIHFPIYTWNMPSSEIEFSRVYYSTISFHPQVNGTSGYSPSEWEEMASELLGNFPNNETFSTLKSLHVEYLIIHPDEYDTLSGLQFKSGGKLVVGGEEIIKKLNQSNKVKLLQQDKKVYLYQLL